MAEVTGIDHLCIAVSDPAKSECFYDRVLIEALGFRKNEFTLADDPHIQYFNRHFAVLSCARSGPTQRMSRIRRNCITPACVLIHPPTLTPWPGSSAAREST